MIKGGQRTEPENSQLTEQERRRQPEKMSEDTPNLRPQIRGSRKGRSLVTPKAPEHSGTRKDKGTG